MNQQKINEIAGIKIKTGANRSNHARKPLDALENTR